MRRILVRAAGGLESMIVETNAPIPRNSHQVRVRVEYAGVSVRIRIIFVVNETGYGAIDPGIRTDAEFNVNNVFVHSKLIE
jgi:hypothetical protein